MSAWFLHLQESFVGKEFSMGSIVLAIGWFCVITVGSILLGILVSFAFAFLLKQVDSDTEFARFELAFILLSAYISYSVAEVLGLSGIMALFFCGICGAHYSYHNISEASRVSSKHAFEALAYMAEIFVYAYLGMQVVIMEHEADLGLLVSALPLCLLSRALNIYPLAWLANKGRSRKISNSMKLVMWVSGLRGAIAYALAINMPSENLALETTTLYIVVTTTLIFGGATGPLVRSLGLAQGLATSRSAQIQRLLELANEKSEPDTSDRSSEHRPSSDGFHSTFRWVDHNYLRPMFGGELERPLLDDILSDGDPSR
eukprot:SM000042S15371  [mRNA]  locus=s42:597293:598662:+ [translate_table: standard]